MLNPGQFTPEYWEEIRAKVEALETGGVLLISVEKVDCNAPRVRYGVFTKAERQRLKKNLKGVEKRREKAALCET